MIQLAAGIKMAVGVSSQIAWSTYQACKVPNILPPEYLKALASVS